MEPSRWDNDTLASVVRVRYTKTIPSYYPYTSVSATAQPPPGSTLVPSPSGGSSGTPSWVAPVLGVVLGLIAFGVLVAVVLLWRRRQRIKHHGSRSDSSTAGFNGNRIMSWLQGTPTSKTGTVATATHGPSSVSGGTTALGSTGELSNKEATMPQETAGTEIHELPGIFIPSFS